MSSAVPFLTRDYIESEADALLIGYGEKFGPVTKPPIPADDILNAYLQLVDMGKDAGEMRHLGRGD